MKRFGIGLLLCLGVLVTMAFGSAWESSLQPVLVYTTNGVLPGGGHLAGAVITNLGAVGAITITLPAAARGDHYTFVGH